ncbi:molecular chaperone (small heat shock protein) [Thiovulum sp. ES]|nr:molecular chaperone (small heat shock protein) [Thiovulum sp. ES]
MKKFISFLIATNLSAFAGGMGELAIVESYFNSFANKVLNDSDFDIKIANFPAINIYERNDSYLIEIEVSGISKDEIEIELVENSILKISGEKKSRENEKLISAEGFFGEFEKSFSLPTNVKTSSIAVEYKNGILFISIEKSKESNSRVIPIN